MSYINTTARKNRKLTRKTITEIMNRMSYKKDKWNFFNPVSNETVELDSLGVEGMLYGMVPFAREADFKYGQGVARILLSHSEIESNFTNANRLNEIIKIIISAHQNEWDNNLNNSSLRDLIKLFHGEVQELTNEEKEELNNTQFIPNNLFDIVHIKDFVQAQEYKSYTSWCITSNESMWDNYTADGMNNVYFILHKDYKKMVPLNLDKKDAYSLSMVCVIVRPRGALAFCTGRYNHSNGANDNLLTIKEISELIGRNYYTVFLPKEGEELKNAIFRKWKEIEGDSVSKVKGWVKVEKVDGKCQYPPKVTQTYYDPELLYLIYDEVSDVDEYGNRIVKLNNKYNIINEKGDLLL